MSEDLLNQTITTLLEKLTTLTGLSREESILAGLQLLAREQDPAWRKRIQVTGEIYVQCGKDESPDSICVATKWEGEEVYLRPLAKGEKPVNVAYVERISLTNDPRPYDVKIHAPHQNFPSWLKGVELPPIYLIETTQFFVAEDGTVFAVC